MPAAAKGKFFFSMSLQMSRIFVIMLFVAVASLSEVSSPRVSVSVKRETAKCDQPSGRHKASANSDAWATRPVNTKIVPRKASVLGRLTGVYISAAQA